MASRRADLHEPRLMCCRGPTQVGSRSSAGRRGSFAAVASYALTDQSREALAAVDLSRRDWHLLQLRRQWFGSLLAGYADCPACGERMEVDVDAGAIVGEYPANAPVFVSRDGHRFRFPTIGDLLAIAGIDDAAIASRQLLGRCSLDEARPEALPAIFDEVDDGHCGDGCRARFSLARRHECGTRRTTRLIPPSNFGTKSLGARSLLICPCLHPSTEGRAGHSRVSRQPAGDLAG